MTSSIFALGCQCCSALYTRFVHWYEDASSGSADYARLASSAPSSSSIHAKSSSFTRLQQMELSRMTESNSSDQLSVASGDGVEESERLLRNRFVNFSQTTLLSSLPHGQSSPRPPECVICMEEFTSENPRMPTLCACGENRTQFHYPCLLLWLEQKNTCPTCSSTLFYEVLNTQFIQSI